MVDVFEMGPHHLLARPGAGPVPFAYAGQGARVARYQHLVSKLGADPANDPAGVRVDWLADGDGDAHSNRPGSVKTLPDDEGGATLVGTFADAAAAMQ